MTLPDVTDVLTDSPPRRRRGWVNRVVGVACWLLTFGIASELAFSYLLPQRLGDTSHPYARLAEVAFFGRVFTFHAGLVLAGIFVIALGLRRWRLAIVTAMAAAGVLWPSAVACLPRHPPRPVGPTVRLMSMNTKYTNSDPVDVVAQVRLFQPDVLVVQEFANSVKEALDDGLTGDYPFRCLRGHDGIGLAVYSRLPFESGPPQVSIGQYRRQIRAVIRVGDRPVALYVLHPLSPRSARRVIYNRLSTADLVAQLGRERLPVVLAGDFNFTAETPNAAALTNLGLTDAFDLAGTGRGSTWPVRPRWAAWLPGVRIDHVYLSPGLTCTRLVTGGYVGSDHLPIIADLGVAAGVPR